MGVNTFLLKLLAYAMGALFAGLAGAFFCARMRFVSPESFTFLESAMVLSMVVLGGMGSIPGIILGAAALIVLPEVFPRIRNLPHAGFRYVHGGDDAVPSRRPHPGQAHGHPWRREGMIDG
jgi:ABC-type branched-subunit amino acid transport system permease subunit